MHNYILARYKFTLVQNFITYLLDRLSFPFIRKYKINWDTSCILTGKKTAQFIDPSRYLNNTKNVRMCTHFGSKRHQINVGSRFSKVIKVYKRIKL